MKYPTEYFSHYHGRAAFYELPTCGVCLMRIGISVEQAQTTLAIRLYLPSEDKKIPICRYPTGEEYARIIALFFSKEEQTRLRRTFYRKTLFVEYFPKLLHYEKSKIGIKYHKKFSFQLWREQQQLDEYKSLIQSTKKH